jgi:hypothetical protein
MVAEWYCWCYKLAIKLASIKLAHCYKPRFRNGSRIFFNITSPSSI